MPNELSRKTRALPNSNRSEPVYESITPQSLPASAPAAPPTTYPNYLAPQNQNVAERQKTEKRDYSIVGMGGGVYRGPLAPTEYAVVIGDDLTFSGKVPACPPHTGRYPTPQEH